MFDIMEKKIPVYIVAYEFYIKYGELNSTGTSENFQIYLRKIYDGNSKRLVAHNTRCHNYFVIFCHKTCFLKNKKILNKFSHIMIKQSILKSKALVNNKLRPNTI